MWGMRWYLQTVCAGLTAGVCFGAIKAHAGDAAWNGFYGGNWDDPTHWDPPAVPDGAASFGPTIGLPNPVSITFSANTSIRRMQFTLGSGAVYTFTLPSNVLTIGGAGNFQGVSIDVESTGPTFTQSQTGGLIFTGNANSSDSFSTSNLGTTKTGAIINNNGTGFTQFKDKSTAGFAKITNTGGGTTFEKQSTAGSSKIENTGGGHSSFNDQSNADNASIINTYTGATYFLAQSNASNASITNDNGGVTVFTGGGQGLFGASAGNATIGNGSIGQTLFLLRSTAGSTKIVNNGGGLTLFQDTTSAVGANIANSLTGKTEFHGQSTADLFSPGNNAFISNQVGGATNFHNESSATGAYIVNGDPALDPGGSLNFYDMSTAAFAKITNNWKGQTNFYDHSSGGMSSDPPIASITNNDGGRTTFNGFSTAGFTRIINFLGGETDFYGNSDGGNAIVADCGGQHHFYPPSSVGGAVFANVCASPSIPAPNSKAGGIFFKDQSTGGNARFIVGAGGRLDISGLTTAGMTAGSIEGTGSFLLGSKMLTVGGSNLSTEVGGVIADAGGLVKVGNGTLILSGVNTYTGTTTLNAGALIVNGSIAASIGLEVNSGALVGGIGTLPPTRINAGGTLSVSAIAVEGNLSFDPGSTYAVEVSPSSPNHPVIYGAASLAGTVMVSYQAGRFRRKYTILSATDGLSGTFDRLVSTGLPGFVTPKLVYTPNFVSLELRPARSRARNSAVAVHKHVSQLALAQYRHAPDQ
jgi:autotransporter-associated beta strand protein